MDTHIITLFCIIDDFFKQEKYKDHVHTKMSSVELIFVMILASYYFGGNFAKTRTWVLTSNCCKYILSESRFNRRLHDLGEVFVKKIVRHISLTIQSSSYIVDSFPQSGCKLVRKYRSKLFYDKHFTGYSASKKEWFHGYKVHMLTTTQGVPVEYYISPGSMHDSKGIKQMKLALPPHATIYADAAYNDYKFEDVLAKKHINIIPKRKSNSKRAITYDPLAHRKTRKRIESTFSSILSLTSRHIHATTTQGFKLKIAFFILAYTLFTFC